MPSGGGRCAALLPRICRSLPVRDSPSVCAWTSGRYRGRGGTPHRRIRPVAHRSRPARTATMIFSPLSRSTNPAGSPWAARRVAGSSNRRTTVFGRQSPPGQASERALARLACTVHKHHSGVCQCLGNQFIGMSGKQSNPAHAAIMAWLMVIWTLSSWSSGRLACGHLDGSVVVAQTVILWSSGRTGACWSRGTTIKCESGRCWTRSVGAGTDTARRSRRAGSRRPLPFSWAREPGPRSPGPV